MIRLNQTLSANANAHPKDVMAIKAFLHAQGFYEAPKFGLTPFPDQALFNAIKAFQKSKGLKVDGVMKPGRQTEIAIKSHAQHLQSMGRNGDTILAHITRTEAKILKDLGGAGTVNPKTGLLEFSQGKQNADKKKGKYIWHTVGDGKVRSSHAERDGETFSWDTPPDGGHPGVAYNCRCTAESVAQPKAALCKDLKHKIDNQTIGVQAAEKDWARIEKEAAAARNEYNILRDKCKNSLIKGLVKTGSGTAAGLVRGGPGGAIGGFGKSGLISIFAAYDVCAEAAAKETVYKTLDESEISAFAYLTEQRKILKNLWKKSTDSGCGS